MPKHDTFFNYKMSLMPIQYKNCLDTTIEDFTQVLETRFELVTNNREVIYKDFHSILHHVQKYK